jgi:anti-sigma B factor antagonist
MIEERPGTPLSSICSARAEQHLDTTIVRLYGEFDLSGEERLNMLLDDLTRTEPATLVVDLRGLAFIDSTGLRVLVSLLNEATREGFDFAILCGEGSVRAVLRETGLDGVLPVIDPAGAVPPADSPV